MIPVNEPLVLEKEIEYVTQALRSGWISSEGKYIRKFEDEFAQYLGMRHAIAVNSGTNALILAMRVLNLPPGSEVILPTMTIISCAMAVIYNDLVPVFVDSEPETWCMDTTKIEERITSRTKAIMPTHLYGHPAGLHPIIDLSKKYNLYVLEDFAEAIGTEYKGKKCGSFGDINCASLYANKTITTGEGGICVTNDDALAAELRKLRNLGFMPERRFVHDELGYNFRMTNIQAAIGLAQIERINDHVLRKIWIGRTYNSLLLDLQKDGIVRLPVEKSGCINTYWVYGLVLSKTLCCKADRMMKLLGENGIQTRPFFFPLHRQPAFTKYSWYRAKEEMPVAEELSDYGLYFPSGLTLAEADVVTVVETFKKIVNEIK